MRKIRFLVFALCVCTASTLLGCNDGRDSVPSDSLPSTSVVRSKHSVEVESPTVFLTPEAAATIGQLIADQPKGNKVYLRVRVVPGGCQGFMHKLDLDTEISSEDQVCESAGICVVTFKRQVGMLKGTQVDFGEEKGVQGFKVENPNFKGDSAKRWLAVLEKEKDVK